VIGGTLGALWAIYRPSVRTTTEVSRTPPPPLPRDAHAVLRLDGPSLGPGERRATIDCDRRARATGFWAARPTEACDALASTRAGLLAGPGCRRTSSARVRLDVRGTFGRRRFTHVQQEGGCPDPDGWLAVNALADPVLAPQRKLTTPSP
jgi:hypothetical protein